MIDTIKTKTRDFGVMDDNSLLIKRRDVLDESVNNLDCIGNLLYKTRNKDVYGLKAYYNEKDGSLTADIRNVTGVPELTIHFSASRILNGHNFYSVGKGGLSLAFDTVEKKLNEVGLMTDVKQAMLSRIDVQKNITLERKFSDYSMIFDSMNLSRMHKRQYRQETYLIENSQIQLAVYDKIEEMVSKKLDVSGFPENVARFEVRLLNKRKIKAMFGIECLGDVCKNYSYVKDVYYEFLRKGIFNQDTVRQIKGKRFDLLSKYIQYASENGNRALYRTVGISKLMDDLGFDGLKIVINAGCKGNTEKSKKDAGNREVKRVMESLYNGRLMACKNDFTDMYRELRTKVLSKAG